MMLSKVDIYLKNAIYGYIRSSYVFLEYINGTYIYTLKIQLSHSYIFQMEEYIKNIIEVQDKKTKLKGVNLI